MQVIKNAKNVWIGKLDLDIYIPQDSQSSPFMALGPKISIQIRTQIFTANDA